MLFGILNKGVLFRMPPKFSEEIVLLFRARPKLRYIEPIEKPEPRKLTPTMSILKYIMEDKLEPLKGETPLPINEARILRRKKREEQNTIKVNEMKERYNPQNDPNATKNPNNTIFLGNLPQGVTENDVRHEFQPFGNIKKINMVKDPKTGNYCNYCFVEYENEFGFRNAYNHRNAQFINKKPIIVDCERARTVPNWLPRRLGGGEGGISRQFAYSKEVLECQIPRKKKRSGWKNGKKYTGKIADLKRKREEKIGVSKFRGQIGRVGYSTFKPSK